MLTFTQSEATAARRRVPLHLVDATDGITPETAEAAGQPQLSKNGAAFVNTTATLTAIGNGAYYVELTAAELDTAGFIVVRYKSAATAEAQTAACVTVAQAENVFSRIGAPTGASIAADLVVIDDFLDTEIAAILAAVDTEIADIQSRLPAALVGGRMNSSVGAVANDAITAAGLAADASTEIAAAVNTVALVESYRANGAQGTLTQLLYEILAHLTEASIAGTTKTIKKIDHTTVAATATLDSATAPTSITRAT